MRRILIALAVGAVAGCTGLTEIFGPQINDEDDIWTGPGASIPDDSGAVCYVTGFDYPQGYDWKKTDATENQRCSLVVFADGAPKLKLPVGEGHEVSADPDMHKIVDGHLYTVFCSDGQTVIRKDGKALIRFEGKESVRGMLVEDGALYTLGVPFDGGGFIFRKNGETVMERRNGFVFERLHLDSGKICFAFCQQVTTPEGVSDRFYMVRNGRTSLVSFPEDISKVWDMISHQGQTWSLVSSGPWSSVELICGEERKSVGLPSDAEMISSRLFAAGKDLCVEGMYHYRDSILASGIWVEGEEYMIFETGQAIAATCTSEQEICCVLNPDRDNPGLIFKSGRTFIMPEGYTCTGNGPIAFHEGKLYAGLTSTEGMMPVIWQDGDTQEIRLNGPVCSLAFSSGGSE